ncbi:hypothetical protein AMECASPLE_016999 [Ameca splendens]|uniref:Uncharacterized protein n=1 Tax=Ameca splendens TaxID=208324 RepID=A0ABV0XR60_9TELE
MLTVTESPSINCLHPLVLAESHGSWCASPWTCWQSITGQSKDTVMFLDCERKPEDAHYQARIQTQVLCFLSNPKNSTLQIWKPFSTKILAERQQCYQLPHHVASDWK